MLLSRIPWLRGVPDRAIRAAERCGADARASNHVMISLCNALAHGVCPVELWTGDLSLAERPASPALRSGHSEPLSTVHNSLLLRLAELCSDMVGEEFRSTREDLLFGFTDLGRLSQCSRLGR